MENITDTSFHGGKEKHQQYYENLMQKAVIDGRITERDAIQIKAFLSEIKGLNGISTHRIYKLSYQLVGMRKWFPEYSELTNTTFFSGLEDFKNKGGYTQTTQSDMIKITRRFLLWLDEAKESSPNLDVTKIRKIKTKGVIVTKTADDILTPVEVAAIFDAVTTTRNRALVEILYESMGRCGEIATLRWNQITFYKGYASVKLDGKTGKMRPVTLQSSNVRLRQWRDMCGNPQPNDLVFPSRPGSDTLMSYNGMKKIVKKAAKKAGIEKSISLHTFRHSRITHLMQQGVPEKTIKMQAWGDVSTDMLKVYAHLTPSDVEMDMLKHYGIETDDNLKQIDNTLDPIQCKICGLVNPHSSQFCYGCNQALSADAVNEIANLQKIIENDPLFLQRVLQLAIDAQKTPQT